MGTRPEPIINAVGIKEILTAIVVLVFLFSRDLGFDIPQDTQLQVILVVTLLGGAAAAYYARTKATPVEAPRLPEGTIVTVTTDKGTPTGTTTV
mgnify:CR=1 FL=1